MSPSPPRGRFNGEINRPMSTLAAYVQRFAANVNIKMNERAQVDLIDFQSHPDGESKHIMTYQDHQTKFVLLRALKSETSSEVSRNLLDIFLTIGAPVILQSDNGREFVSQRIERLKEIYPSLKIAVTYTTLFKDKSKQTININKEYLTNFSRYHWDHTP